MTTKTSMALYKEAQNLGYQANYNHYEQIVETLYNELRNKRSSELLSDFVSMFQHEYGSGGFLGGYKLDSYKNFIIEHTSESTNRKCNSTRDIVVILEGVYIHCLTGNTNCIYNQHKRYLFAKKGANEGYEKNKPYGGGTLGVLLDKIDMALGYVHSNNAMTCVSYPKSAESQKPNNSESSNTSKQERTVDVKTEELEEEIRKLKNQLSIKVGEISDLKTKNGNLNAKIDALAQQLLDKGAEIRELNGFENRFNRLTQEHNDLVRKHEDLTKEYETLEIVQNRHGETMEESNERYKKYMKLAEGYLDLCLETQEYIQEIINGNPASSEVETLNGLIRHFGKQLKMRGFTAIEIDRSEDWHDDLMQYSDDQDECGYKLDGEVIRKAKILAAGKQ